MLVEWYKYLTTPCPAHVSEMGYLRELIGMESRFHRCRKAWQPHLEACKEVMRTASGLCRQKRRVIVLGSGLLVDVPLPELSALFQEVILVDIFHLPQVRKQVKRYPNVCLVSCDVTGMVEDLYELVPEMMVTREKFPLPNPVPRFFLEDSGVDLVISANIMGQLPILPAEYLEQVQGLSLSTPLYSEQELTVFRRNIITQHLDYLLSFACRVCLVTDTQRLLVDEREVVVQEESALEDVPLAFQGREWLWNIAPRPEVDKKLSLVHRVVGIPDLRGAIGRY